jgi:lysophospholipase L1-like esterase
MSRNDRMFWRATRHRPPPAARRRRTLGVLAALAVLLVAVPVMARPPDRLTAEEMVIAATKETPDVLATSSTTTSQRATTTATSREATASSSSTSAANATTTTATTAATAATTAAPTATTIAPAAPTTVAPTTAAPTTAPPAPPPPTGVLVIGDSVALGASGSLRAILGEGTMVDGQVGRQGSDGPAVVASWLQQGWAGNVLVIHLGSNGNIRADALDAMVAAVPDRRVALVTVHVPRPWEGSSNDEIRAAAGRYPNTVLVDWHAFSQGHGEWFGEDGFHLTQSGADAYATLIRDTIA